MDMPSSWVGRAVFVDRDVLGAVEGSTDESCLSSDAESIASVDFPSITPGSPASSANESIVVDRPRGRFGSASADEGASEGSGR
eukprot:8863029-Lingulodinium_polyedra.AAC.1